MIRAKAQCRRGISVVYMAVFLVVLCALCSLGVDLGRVQLAKTELRRAADGAARAGAAGLAVDSSEAVRLARQFASLNRVDGVPLDLNLSTDIELGWWDSTQRTFQRQVSGPVNAVRIFAQRTTDRGNAIPTLFASLVGFASCDIRAESIVSYVPGINVDQHVPATANPFLAGMPSGTAASLNNPHNSPDYAGTAQNPRQSPLAVNMTFEPGQVLNFDSISGTARHDPNLAYYSPDGQANSIGRNTNGNEHGIADMIAPINSLVGVFLGDDLPNRSSAPANLNFSTPASRDFSRLEPELKQIFFIGDGLDSKGNRQQFVVPQGATRLFLATWDFYEWNNNAGSRNIQVYRPAQITTVK